MRSFSSIADAERCQATDMVDAALHRRIRPEAKAQFALAAGAR
jgi:hypothetical protein